MDSLDVINNFMYLFNYYIDILTYDIDNIMALDITSMMYKAKELYIKDNCTNEKLLTNTLDKVYNYINNKELQVL